MVFLPEAIDPVNSGCIFRVFQLLSSSFSGLQNCFQSTGETGNINGRQTPSTINQYVAFLTEYYYRPDKSSIFLVLLP